MYSTYGGGGFMPNQQQMSFVPAAAAGMCAPSFARSRRRRRDTRVRGQMLNTVMLSVLDAFEGAISFGVLADFHAPCGNSERRPMGLNLYREQLQRGVYLKYDDLMSDAVTIFLRFTYSEPDSMQFRMATALREYFLKLTRVLNGRPCSHARLMEQQQDLQYILSMERAYMQEQQQLDAEQGGFDDADFEPAPSAAAAFAFPGASAVATAAGAMSALAMSDPIWDGDLISPILDAFRSDAMHSIDQLTIARFIERVEALVDRRVFKLFQEPLPDPSDEESIPKGWRQLRHDMVHEDDMSFRELMATLLTIFRRFTVSDPLPRPREALGLWLIVLSGGLLVQMVLPATPSIDAFVQAQQHNVQKATRDLLEDEMEQPAAAAAAAAAPPSSLADAAASVASAHMAAKEVKRENEQLQQEKDALSASVQLLQTRLDESEASLARVRDGFPSAAEQRVIQALIVSHAAGVKQLNATIQQLNAKLASKGAELTAAQQSVNSAARLHAESTHRLTDANKKLTASVEHLQSQLVRQAVQQSNATIKLKQALSDTDVELSEARKKLADATAGQMEHSARLNALKQEKLDAQTDAFGAARHAARADADKRKAVEDLHSEASRRRSAEDQLVAAQQHLSAAAAAAESAESVRLVAVKQEKIDAMADALGAGRLAHRAQEEKRKAELALQSEANRRRGAEDELAAAQAQLQSVAAAESSQSSHLVSIKQEKFDAQVEARSAGQQAQRAGQQAQRAQAEKRKALEELESEAKRCRGVEGELAALIEQMDEKDKCAICLEKQPDVLFSRCKHLACCSGCVDLLMRGGAAGASCPLCRVSIRAKDVIKVMRS